MDERLSLVLGLLSLETTFDRDGVRRAAAAIASEPRSGPGVAALMTDDEEELRELRALIEAERQRINAYEDMLGVAVADKAAYKAAFMRLLEMLPEGAPLKVVDSVRRKMH